MQMPKTQLFDFQKTNSKVFNGIHPGVPLTGTNCNDMRFDLLINDLMPQDCHKITTTDYDWKKGSIKHTLKEFEKEIYHSNGDYQKACSQVFLRRLMTGNHVFEK